MRINSPRIFGLVVAVAAVGYGSVSSGSEGTSSFPLSPPSVDVKSAPAPIAVSKTGCPVPAPVGVEKPATRNEAARFLAQATFGPVDDDIDRLMLIGYSAWIDEQFNAPRIDTHQAHYERAALLFDPNRKPSLEPVWGSFWKQALTGSDQLRQRMAYALSQIFVISLENNTINDDPRAVAAFMDVLSNNSFGSYRKLLEDVALHPQMGIYLTHIRNQKADPATGRVPDQNFAREIMQLFTIGVVELNEDGSTRTGPNGAALEAYTPDDVAGLASVFTGWSWDCPQYPSYNCFNKGSTGPGNLGQRDPDRNLKPMRPYAQFHTTEAKTFLGTTIPAQTSNPAESLRQALDWLFAHPNVGPFIGRQFIQRFTTSNPSPAYVKAVAQAFANNGSGVRGDLKATLKAVLMHPEARVLSDTSGKVREPVLRLSAFMRAFSYKSGTGNFLVGNTIDPGEALAQTPMYAPSVFNFYRPGYVAPGSQSAARNMVAPELQITSELTVAGYVNYMMRGISSGVSNINYNLPGGGRGRDLQSDYVAELALAGDVPMLVDRVTTRLTYGAASAALRTEIANAVGSITIPTGGSQTRIDDAKRARVNAAILLTIASPEFVVLK
jgi:uncharacterized protein (DUF1800 family)